MPLCSNLSAIENFHVDRVTRRTRSRPRAISDDVDQQAVPQLRLEPRGLRRHDRAGVRHGHQVGDADRDTARTRPRPCPSPRAARARAVPRAPPTKSIRLSVRTSAIFSTGASSRSCSTLTSSEPIGSDAVRRHARPQRVPAAAGSTSRCRRDAPASPGPASTSKRSRTACEERVGRQAAEILHDPVVRQDLHLVVRKRHRQHRRRIGAVAERRAGSSRSRISVRARAALAAR